MIALCLSNDIKLKFAVFEETTHSLSLKGVIILINNYVDEIREIILCHLENQTQKKKKMVGKVHLIKVKVDH